MNRLLLIFLAMGSLVQSAQQPVVIPPGPSVTFPTVLGLTKKVKTLQNPQAVKAIQMAQQQGISSGLIHIFQAGGIFGKQKNLSAFGNLVAKGNDEWCSDHNQGDQSNFCVWNSCSDSAFMAVLLSETINLPLNPAWNIQAAVQNLVAKDRGIGTNQLGQYFNATQTAQSGIPVATSGNNEITHSGSKDEATFDWQFQAFMKKYHPQEYAYFRAWKYFFIQSKQVYQGGQATLFNGHPVAADLFVVLLYQLGMLNKIGAILKSNKSILPEVSYRSGSNGNFQNVFEYILSKKQYQTLVNDLIQHTYYLEKVLTGGLGTLTGGGSKLFNINGQATDVRGFKMALYALWNDLGGNGLAHEQMSTVFGASDGFVQSISSETGITVNAQNPRSNIIMAEFSLATASTENSYDLLRLNCFEAVCDRSNSNSQGFSDPGDYCSTMSCSWLSMATLLMVQRRLVEDKIFTPLIGGPIYMIERLTGQSQNYFMNLARNPDSAFAFRFYSSGSKNESWIQAGVMQWLYTNHNNIYTMMYVWFAFYISCKGMPILNEAKVFGIPVDHSEQHAGGYCYPTDGKPNSCLDNQCPMLALTFMDIFLQIGAFDILVETAQQIYQSMTTVQTGKNLWQEMVPQKCINTSISDMSTYNLTAKVANGVAKSGKTAGEEAAEEAGEAAADDVMMEIPFLDVISIGRVLLRGITFQTTKTSLLDMQNIMKVILPDYLGKVLPPSVYSAYTSTYNNLCPGGNCQGINPVLQSLYQLDNAIQKNCDQVGAVACQVNHNTMIDAAISVSKYVPQNIKQGLSPNNNPPLPKNSPYFDMSVPYTPSAASGEELLNNPNEEVDDDEKDEAKDEGKDKLVDLMFD